MKALTFWLLVLAFFQIIPVERLSSQSCLPEGIHFAYQSQVDSFQVHYPGCCKIEGNVKISGDHISNLSGLNVLDTIGGDLEIVWNDRLFSLDGLQQLTTIGGNLLINENMEMTSLDGLNNLTSIGGSLMIGDWWSGNYSLPNLDGLSSLTSLGGGIFIGFNRSLTSLTGLSNLSSISGDLNIFHNVSLTSLSGLENINASGIERIWIYDNPLLTGCNIQGICEYLTDIPDMIGIYNNAPGCNNPHEIADSCGFDLSCLPFGNYYFISQAEIDSFPSYYPSCNKIEGITHIEGDNITHLDSLYAIDTISGSVYICGNPLLTSLSGLNNLRTVTGSLYLGYWEHGYNPLLTDMTGLNKLHDIGGEMVILGNASLQNFNGLDSLEEIEKWFSIIQNPSLKSFEGLISLHSVGEIGISDNDSLLSLNGLEPLVNVTFSVIVQYNPFLASLDGIENIDADSLLFLRIINNDTLSECNVKSVCDFLGIPEANYIIEDNASGCNTPEEVEAACEVGYNEPDTNSGEADIVFYPNPIKAQARFIIQQDRPGWVRLSVYNNLGQFITEILDEPLPAGTHSMIWSLTDLPAGLYFYQLSGSSHHKPVMGKIVVLK